MKIQEEKFSVSNAIENHNFNIINGSIENTTFLVTFNAKSKLETRKPIILQYYFNHDSCIGQLPNDELFFINPDGSEYGSIMNTKSLKIRKILLPWKFYTATCTYFQNSLYIFGFKGKFTGQSCATKYDLILNRWIKLSSFEMFVSTWNWHCAPFKNSILLSSINIRILRYDIIADSYSGIPIEIDSHCVKILLVGNSRIYIILPIEGSIYESGVNDEYLWNKIPGIIFKPCFDVYWKTYYKNSLYFGVIENSDLKGKTFYSYYQFSLKTKKLKKIKYHQNPCLLF